MPDSIISRVTLSNDSVFPRRAASTAPMRASAKDSVPLTLRVTVPMPLPLATLIMALLTIPVIHSLTALVLLR